MPIFRYALASTPARPARLRGLPQAAAALGIALALAAGPAPLPAYAEPVQASTGTVATPVVDAFYTVLLAVMKDGPTLGFSGRVAQLTPAITRAFDLPAMTRIAAGAQWPTLAADDQHRLIDAFGRFSVASYAANFDSFDGERFEVLREVPAPGSGGGVIVESRLLPRTGDPVQFNYLLRRGTDGLQIIDVFVNGTISEMAARRSEFSSVLNRGGAQALIEVLETRIKALAARK